MVVLVGSYPLVAVAVPSGSSTLLLIFTLLALSLWRYLPPLQRDERRLAIALLLLLILAAISTLLSQDQSEAIKRLERLLRLALIPLIIKLFSTLPQPLTLKSLLYGITLALIWLAGEGLLTMTGIITQLPTSRVNGLYYPIYYGSVAALFTVWLVVNWQLYTLRWQRILQLTALTAGLFALIVSGTRGAWLAFAMIMPWLLFQQHYAKYRLPLRQIIPFAILALLIVIYTFPTLSSGILQGIDDLHRFYHDPSHHSSWGARLGLWYSSLVIAWHHPFLGIGIGDFLVTMQQMATSGESISHNVAHYGHAHNIYLHTVAVMGIPALLLLIYAIIWQPWQILNRATPPTTAIILSGKVTLLAFAIFGISEAWITRNPFVNDYIILISLAIASRAPAAQQNSPE
jgi:O-antigen ligase